MKALEIIPDFGTGGAEKVVLTYLQELKDDKLLNVKAIVLSSNKGRLYEKIIEEQRLNVHFLNQNISDNSVFGRVRQIFELRSAIKENNPDIVHIHLSILWMVCLACIGLKIKKKFHTLHSDPYKTSIGKNVYIDRICYKIFNVRPICLNNEMKKHADTLFHRNDTLVLQNGVSINSKSSKNRKEVLDEIGLKDDQFIVGHVGRFIDVKNHVKIVSVFREVIKKNPKARLVLIGEGEAKETIEKKCSDLNLLQYVLFLGTRTDIAEIMKAFDVFIFPSKYEGLGIVLIEAQAAKLWCIISENVPNESIVSDKVIKLKLDDSDELWADAVLNHNITAEKKTHDIEYYSLETVMSKLREIYIC